MPALRILDLSVNLPGPYATWVLAGLGADVIKVEPPRGDPARHIPTLFARVNAGKRSVVLDLRDPATHPAMWALLAWADVLVEGFRPGVLERLGFGPAVLHARLPDLVVCRISAFGQASPLASLPAHDLNLQATTGFSWLERTGRRPGTTRLPLADLSTSLAAVVAIQEAVASGRSETVLDVAMADALHDWTSVWAELDPGEMADPWIDGLPAGIRSPTRRILRPLRRRLDREKLEAMPAYGLFSTADGHVAIGIVDEQHFWRNLMTELGLHRHAGHPMVLRTLLGPLLRGRIARRLRRRTTAHWIARLQGAGLPVTAVHVGTPVRSGRPPIAGPEASLTEAPSLGQHTLTILDAIPSAAP